VANKYLIQGATYCGDGTTSAEAASAGAAGAWNNINVFQGTAPAYGTLAASDVVYIRSKTSAGADIAVSISGAALYLGSTAAAELTPIQWVIDSGTVWSGISGTVTFTMTDGNIIYTRNYNNINAGEHKLILVHAYTNFANTTCILLGAAITHGVKIDTSAFTGSYGGNIYVESGTHVNLYSVSKHAYHGVMVGGGQNRDITLINPTIECLAVTELGWAGTLFNDGGNFGGSFVVFGGRAFGAGCYDARTVHRIGANAGASSYYGFQYPRNMVLVNSFPTYSSVFANGGDGVVGNAYADYNYFYDSRDDGYYPTLNALLETSVADGWSYKVYPYRTTKQKPARVPVSKLYALTAAAKTITLELLWPTSMSAPTKELVYMSVAYTDDSTGVKKFVTSLDPAGGTLATSTAAWSATTYGASSFTKYKLEVTTPTSIKQDTEVMAVLLSSPRSASATDIVFVDPDFTLT
jgi:hypothetical protein